MLAQGDGYPGDYTLSVAHYVLSGDSGFEVVAQYIAELTREVSHPRLAKYRPAGGTDLDMASNYLWNMMLAEALHPSLSALEIGLRNGIHNALTQHYGTDLWFYQHDFVTNRNLGQELHRAVGRLGGPARQPLAGRIVAELHFFYWTTVISRDYHNLLWHPNRALLLKQAFPNVTGAQFRRDLIHQRYNTIRIFRNRVMHNEPLVYGFTLPGQPNISLDIMHRNIVEAVGWVSPQLQASLLLIDRFPHVLATGQRTVESALRDHLRV